MAYFSKKPTENDYTYTVTKATHDAYASYTVLSNGRWCAEGTGKTEWRAIINAKAVIKKLKAANLAAIHRWEMSMDAHADHPIIVAANENLKASLAAIGDEPPVYGCYYDEKDNPWREWHFKKQACFDVFHKETGYYYHIPGTPFVPGMKEGHYA